MILQQLRRVRWAVRATLLLGVAASVVANVLHARDNPISQAIAAWPPLALLLTVELISRVPVHRRYLAATRLIATAIIAGIAAWVSYWHMVGVAARYGETGASPYLLPLSVDGLIVVASICLVELAGRISTLERAKHEPTPAPTPVPVPGPAPVPVPVPAAAFPAAAAPEPVPGLIPSPLSAAHARVNGPSTRGSGPLSPTTAAALAEVAAALPRPTPNTARAAVSTGRAVPAQRSSTTPSGRAVTGRATSNTNEHPTVAKPRRTPAETVALAAQIKAARPDLSEAELAAELGISPSRWRSIRREAA
ncbi:DUF2637 domain-containing protein [Paractinoplanes hotanensis]|uniref:DUF2637 domain-containing protein n=1 Tax=Paractinoplanes hotanensis TaxID=2906497 RepID=A0ABT0YBZ8_9ACTN|nr:DUF2637 domain-containing protein [Actinoplanes hotanensis]MCM4083270.1 DUF2637 domain-containing protein [Actinoplanes hotanensis]